MVAHLFSHHRMYYIEALSQIIQGIPSWGGSIISGSGWNHFRAFGITIASDIFLPELEAAEGYPDVRVVFDRTPREIPEAFVKNNHYQAAPDKFLFRVEGVGHYYVTKGNRIALEPDQSAEAGAVRLYLLGTAFGALLLQRGVLPIHGSAVVINGRAVIIAGVSGAGKSTLLTALRKRGNAFLTDDVAAVTVDGSGVPWVEPGYPHQKLWRDSAENMGVDVSGYHAILAGMDKYAVPLEEGFCRARAPLTALCELRMENCREATLTRLAGPDKLTVMLKHTYRRWLLDGLGLKVSHFNQCSAAAKAIAVCSLARPKGKFSVEEQARLVERLVSEEGSGYGNIETTAR
jgi:hypothetical protein